METIKALTGKNKTGVARAKDRCEEMLRSNQEFAPAPSSDDTLISEVRQAYAAEGELIGTLPPPASMQQLGKTAAAVLKAERPTIFVDKLAARLAFERSGVRIYQALLSKFDAANGSTGGATRVALEQILAEELAHFVMLEQAIEHLGADPTAMTPAADIESTASGGLLALLVDARTTFPQGLDAILILELTDNEMWDVLVELADEHGEAELATQFRRAREEEREHLIKVRGWIAATRRSS